MSLYVFNVKPTSAIITADTRQSITINGEIYKLHDNAQKLIQIDDMVITMGGVAFVCNYILKQWERSNDHSVENLRQTTLKLLPTLNGVADKLGVPHDDYLSNPYLLEFCILRFDPVRGCNVFYQIATSSSYNLVEFVVDGRIHPFAMIYGGIDFDIVQDYFNSHPVQVAADYINAVKTAYTLATSEKIGGTLKVVTQQKGNITTSNYPLQDRCDVRRYAGYGGEPHNLVGKNLMISCPDVNGDMMQVKIDRQGFFQYNGRNYFQSDRGGRLGQDANWGIFGGTEDLFTVTDTGYIHPSFAGDNGTIKLDDEGFPLDTNFLLGIDGDAYFRGTVHATGGKFTGDLYANNLYFNDGGDVKTLLSQATKKISSGLLDLGNIQLDGDSGDINMTGSINMDGDIKLKGNITWDQFSFPLKSQFSSSITGPWHDTMQTNDKYRRDIAYDGTWGVPYQFVGMDGKNGANGSDASVNFSNVLSALQNAASTKTTFITADQVGAPTIYGAKIYGAEIYAGGVGEKGGQVIGLTDKGIEVFNGAGTKVLGIAGDATGAYLTTGYNSLSISTPYLHFGDATNISFEALKADFTKVKEMDFTGVKTTGLHYTFA